MNVPGIRRHAARPDAFVPSAELPWIPSGTPGKSAKPLRFLGDAGFVELLRMEPGTVMPLHRHTGLVHVHQLRGRRLLDTGQTMGAGDYLLEPAGNIDGWKIVGDETMLAFVVVMGEVQFLGPDGEVRSVANAASQRLAYLEYCDSHGITPRRLEA